jgi:hypothetical protein
MPHSTTTVKRRSRSGEKHDKRHQSKAETRFTVGLAPSLANQVQKYAVAVDASMSKAIATLVRLGLESQESRKREFFKKLKDNLSNGDPNQQDRLVDEFRALILGR